jgi:hypothetical protein
MNSEKTPKSYIITTGDISDFDGFLAFPLYKEKADQIGCCDVVFIMNYPAYMNDKIGPIELSKKGGKYKKEGGGLEEEFIKIKNKIKEEINLDLIDPEGTFFDIDDKKIILTEDESKSLDKYKRNSEGLGYYYNADELFSIQPLNKAAKTYRSMNKKGGENPSYQDLMMFLAYDMCTAIWEEIIIPGAVQPKLIFINGGINEINPFSIRTIKNEFNVYASAFIDNIKITGGKPNANANANLVAAQDAAKAANNAAKAANNAIKAANAKIAAAADAYAVANAKNAAAQAELAATQAELAAIKAKIKASTNNANRVDGDRKILDMNWFNGINKDNTKDIYMDMNGSMAFYDETFNTKVIQSGLLKSVFIMGGVLSNVPPDTLSIMPFLNRFSSATMNQLYAKEKTGQFFKDINTANTKNKINVYIISNNEINKNLTYAKNDFKKKMLELGLLSGNKSELLFDKFYEAKKSKYLDIYLIQNEVIQNKKEVDNLVPTPYKPFDVLSAFVLVQKCYNSSHQNNNQNLIYIPRFGSTIIGDIENFKTTLNSKIEGMINNYNDKNKNNQYNINITNEDDKIFGLTGVKKELEELSNIKKDIIEIPIINYDSKTRIENNVINFKESLIGGSTDKINVLGRFRNIKVIKRCKYIIYKKQLIKVSDARILEKKMRLAAKK